MKRIDFVQSSLEISIDFDFVGLLALLKLRETEEGSEEYQSL